MNILTLTILFSLIGLTLLQTYFTIVFLTAKCSNPQVPTFKGGERMTSFDGTKYWQRPYKRKTVSSEDQQDLFADEELPKVAIILCLRGADPFLPNCLQALLAQNYPYFELKIVVDSEKDPAWTIAHEIVKQTAIPVQIEPLKVRKKTCSLKCSALIQAISKLNEDCQVIALIDADTIAHPNWLRKLVRPLKSSKIGATTGNRWYTRGEKWGTLCRYIWNAAAVGQMYLYRIPWGGSLAIKTEIVRQTKLLEKWQYAFCEDTMLRRALQEKGLEIKSLTSLMMVNREECTLSNFRYWVSRQLLNAKLYHPSWFPIFIYGTSTTLIPAIALGSLFLALFTQQWLYAFFLGGSLISYITVLAILIGIWEANIAQKLTAECGHPQAPSCKGERMTIRQEILPQYSAHAILKLILAIPLTQLVCAIALWQTMLTKQIEWRGITYQINGPWNIKLLDYFPYQYSHCKNRKTSL